jgi:hypothetical protein
MPHSEICGGEQMKLVQEQVTSKMDRDEGLESFA